MISRLNVMMLTVLPVGKVFFFSRKKESAQLKKASDEMDTSMMCKFVFDGAGKKVGESVSVADDVLIVKSGFLFLGVPLKHVESGGKTLVVKGLLDFTKAYELGEKWRKESCHEMNKNDQPEEKSH